MVEIETTSHRERSFAGSKCRLVRGDLDRVLERVWIAHVP